MLLAVLTSGCGQNREGVRRQALDAVSKQEEYKGLTNSLPAMVDAIDKGKSLLELQPLERQAVLDVLLRTAIAVTPAYSVEAIQPKAVDSGYEQSQGYFREPPETDDLSTDVAGTVEASSAKREFRLNILGTVDIVGGEVTMHTDPHGNRYSIARGGTILAAGHGQVQVARSAFEAAMTNPAVSGIRGSIVVSELGENSLLVETQLPQDRVPLYCPKEGWQMQMQVVLPTGLGTVYGIRGTVHDLYPGITIHAKDGHIVYFALLRDFGLSYFAGCGEVTTAAGTVPLPPTQSKR